MSDTRIVLVKPGDVLLIGNLPANDTIPALLSPGRATTRRPGETWAEATNRLTEGEDL